MIVHYFRAKYQSQIKQIDGLKTGCWVHCEKPSKREVADLSEVYKLEEGAVADALDLYEVPRAVFHEGWAYIYMRAPVGSSRDEIVSTTIPLCIAIGPEYIVTVCQESLKDVWDSVLVSDVLTTQKVRVLCSVMSEVGKMYYRDIAAINRRLRKYTLENEYTNHSDVLQMLSYEHSLNDFLDALVPMKTIMDNILLGKSITLFKQDKDTVEDVQLTFEQLSGWAKSTLRTIQNTREAYSTVLSNRLNNNIHNLTIITIVLAVPTMVAGLYGMNVHLPGQEYTGMFWFVLFGAMILSFIIYVTLKRSQ